MRRVPKLDRKEIENELKVRGIDLDSEKVCLVGIRGYYSRTYGKPGNDRGVYDDALFLITPKSFWPFQANTDPSIFRRGIAVLKAGIYDVVKWRHRGQYAALQITRDVLKRDGIAGLDTGRHGINFHFGSELRTWSEGCQTIPRDTWDFFITRTYALMDFYKKSSIKYVLLENDK